MATQLATAVGANPTGALFGAFLGVNPMTQLPMSIQSLLPPVVFTKEWFPHAIAPAFMQGLDESFLIAGIITVIAALVSLQRGDKYIHELQNSTPTKDPAPSSNPEKKTSASSSGTPK